jgi:SprT protein
MDQLEKNKSILHKYIPEQAVTIIASWIYHYDFKLKIKKERSSKHGDYRPPIKKENHQITVNRNLNKYAFLITLVHEIAHLSNWNKYQNKVRPHGEQWKEEFKILMKPFIHQNIFPEDVKHALGNYLKNPAASSCSDISLSRVLKKYDDKNGLFLLEEIPVRSVFKIKSNKHFIKGERIRTRFKCIEVKTKRVYLFNPLAEIEIVDQQNHN